jgi:hypothetical protein
MPYNLIASAVMVGAALVLMCAAGVLRRYSIRLIRIRRDLLALQEGRQIPVVEPDPELELELDLDDDPEPEPDPEPDEAWSRV